MIYGWCKLFDTTPDHVINHITYENLLLYSAAVPSYESIEKDTENGEIKNIDWDKFDANNPNNFN